MPKYNRIRPFMCKNFILSQNTILASHESSPLSKSITIFYSKNILIQRSSWSSVSIPRSLAKSPLSYASTVSGNQTMNKYLREFQGETYFVSKCKRLVFPCRKIILTIWSAEVFPVDENLWHGTLPNNISQNILNLWTIICKKKVFYYLCNRNDPLTLIEKSVSL